MAMNINFPENPTEGATYTFNFKTWQYTAGAWSPVGTYQTVTGATGPAIWGQTGTAIYYTSGNVGVGTSNPSSKLHVDGTSTFTDVSVISTNSSSTALRITQTGLGAALVVEDSTNPDATPFVVDASGNVGIGTSSPESKLHVDGDILLSGGINSTGSIPLVTSDLTVKGITAQALHRSPNAITSMFIYDTSKDSDGGAWTERCQHTSWWNETIYGRWLGPHANETVARQAFGTLGTELFPSNDFSASTGLLLLSGATITDGVLKLAAVANSRVEATTAITLTTGEVYEVELVITATDGGTQGLQVEANNASIGFNQLLLSLPVPTVGTHRVRASLTGSYSGNNGLRVIKTSATGTTTIDRVSIKRLSGGVALSGDYFQRTSDGKFYSLNAGSGITEVFRGNKRDFPRMAAIVGEASSLTIYDLTEQGRPMFARFIATATGTLSAKNMLSGANALAAMNGRLAVGGSGSNLTGLTLIDFVRDTAELRQTSGYTWSLGGIAMRNSTGGYVTVDANVGGLGNATVRDVSMAVLPDAPVDPVSGLRVPTIALASNYISIIQDEGVVRNSALASAFFSVVLTPSILYAGAADRQELLFVTNPGSVGANFSLASRQGTQAPGFGPALVEKLKGFARTTLLRTNTNRQLFQLACVNESDIGRSIVANLNYALNSGWMTGDIRRCYLTETTAGTITGPAPELVVNGTFDTDLSGWTIYQSTSWVDGAMRIASNGGADPTCFSSPFVVKPGSVYEMTFTLFGSDVVNREAYVRFSTSGFAVNAIAPFDTEGVVTVSPGTTTITTTKTIVPSGVTSMTVSVSLSVGVGNPTAKVDLLSVSVKEVVPSLTTHARGAANINGTLTKTQLASGTSLVGYSGFSAVNYLRESYSADLDFGTGEWTASAWVNVPDSANLGGNLLRNDTIGTQTGSTRITATGPTGISESVGQFGDGITSFFSYSSIPNLQAPVNGRRTTVSLWVKIVSDTSGTSGSVDFYHYAGPPGPLITFSAASQGVGNWFQISRTGVNAGTDNQFRISVPAGMIIQVTRLLLQYGSTVGTFVDGGASQVILRNNVTDRAGASGAFYRLYIDSTGCLGAQAYDGTTTRTVTTTSAYNTGQWIKASVNYTTDGTLALWVNGREVATARGTPLLSLSSRYNLLTWTEQFNNAAWNKDLGGFSIATGASDPLGGNTAITLTASANGSRIWQVATNSGSGNYTASIWIRRRSGSGNINWEASQVGVGSLITVTSEWQKVTFNGIHNVSDYYFGLRVATAGDSIDIAFADLRKSIYDGLPYQRVTSVAETEVAPLTIGNSYALDAPFPGSLALLKLGATVPTAEQDTFMYDQEKQLFRADVACVLPDSSAIVDMAYDDATDRWVAVSASTESYWSGLVRNSVTAVPAGSFTRVAVGSGVELVARSTTNPGVDVTIPAYGLREELVKRAEAAARMSKELANYDYVGGFTANTTTGSTAIISVANLTYPTSYIGARISGSGIPTNTTITGVSGTTIYLSAAATASATGVSISFLDFRLPVGMEARTVFSAGVQQREGSTAAFTRLYDGFVETVRFAVAPGSTALITIQATRGTMQ